MTTNYSNTIHLITLIRSCYGRFSSFRIAKSGMQEITDLYQYDIFGINIREILP